MKNISYAALFRDIISVTKDVVSMPIKSDQDDVKPQLNGDTEEE